MSKRFLLGGPVANVAYLRQSGPAGSRLRSWFFGDGRRMVNPHDRLSATLFHDGDLDRGQTQDEQRTINGLTVTNYTTVAMRVEVEQEANHSNVFSATIQPGETVNVPVEPITQIWNTAGIDGFTGQWDGLNIRFGEV